MKQEITFSGKIKQELAKQWSESRHCQVAEITAIISMCGKVSIDSREQYSIKVRTENISVAKKCFTLLTKTFNIKNEVLVSRNKIKGNVFYTVIVKEHDEAMRLLTEMQLIDEEGEIREEYLLEKNPIVHSQCCKRAFIRGAFLAAGSMSNPEKSYHVEIVCAARKKAEQLCAIINSFGLDAKVISRKNTFVVYLKEGSQIVDFLSIMEASVALMEMENIRILKEIRNSLNRQVNCETANINKTVSAAVKQMEDIRYIQETIGLEELPEGLREIARLRLEYTDATLKELGDMLSTPLGKSGVNHRLRKLSERAEELRGHREE